MRALNAPADRGETENPIGPLVARVAAGGIAGLAIWEAFARLVAPAWIGFPLDPTGLIEMALGIAGAPAQVLHILTGLVAFPLGYALAVRPFAARLGWPVAGAAYGVALWVFALYGMASLIGGAPPFLGFEPIAWASLVGHVGLGLGIAGAFALLPGTTP